MTDYLLYWKTFWDAERDLDAEGHDWHTNDESFHRNISSGDNLWVVVTGGDGYPYEWRLLARSRVLSPDPTPFSSRYGNYHIIADERNSQYFDIKRQSDITPLLKRLEFASGTRIAVDGRKIGNTLQKARKLTEVDSALLGRYAETLPALTPVSSAKSAPPLTLLNRMCWNSRGWRFPTNTSGDGGYPSRMGFGHEEWNFQVEDAVDGYVYGYLFYNKPSREVMEESGGRFKIIFWSMHPDTREKLIVGSYASATLPTDEDYLKVDRAFEEKGIYERRARELCAAVPSMSMTEALREVTGSVQEHWLSFKCPVEEVHHLAEYVPLNEVSAGRKVGYYFARPTIIREGKIPPIPRRNTPSKGRVSRQDVAALAEDAYYRENPEHRKLIFRRHNILSNDFAKWLRRVGYSDVAQEQDYVDVVFHGGGASYRAELKVCYGVGSTKAIREALGQLLEYNYYPNRTPCDRWVIVLDEKATGDDVVYVKTLKEKLNLPLSLGWRNGKDFVFAAELDLSVD